MNPWFQEHKEKIFVFLALVLTVLTALFLSSPKKTERDVPELGQIIPKGFLVVPLELANAESLSHMIQQNGIINVYSQGLKNPLVENLKILKLNNGIGPLFGALVPQKMATRLQEELSKEGLRGALCPLSENSLKIHLPIKNKHVSEITIWEET